jgi:hypothetical protein
VDRVLAAPSNHAIDLTRLSLDDLALAIRPGRKLEVILMTLAQLAAAPADEPSDDDGNAKNRKTTSSSRNRNGTAGTGSVRRRRTSQSRLRHHLTAIPMSLPTRLATSARQTVVVAAWRTRRLPRRMDLHCHRQNRRQPPQRT